MQSTGHDCAIYRPEKFYNEENSLLKWTLPSRLKREDREEPESQGDKVEDAESDLEKTLKSVFPPRQWKEEGEWWHQKVSTEPSSRMDVVNLSQRLDNMMVKLNARETGICEIRRRLFTQLFDEITRQTVIHDRPLGLLLSRVRDDSMATLLCYRSLFESGVEYGLKKASEAEQGRRELEDIIETLKADNERLKEEKQHAMKSVYEKERKSIAEKDLLEALHAEKMDHYEKTNKALQELLDTIMISN